MSLEIAPGEIHALLGHNGSGKSTLVKILAGYHEPDAGEVLLDGQVLSYPVSQLQLAERGVTFLHQDIGLVPTASVLDNVRIGRFETAFGGRIRFRRERDVLSEQLRAFGVDVDPAESVNRLSASERTIVGLVRALQDLEGHSGGLLVLDEATASLPAREVDTLLTAVRHIADRGVAVLLVTHHLNEPIALADRVSVLRDGRLIATVDVAEQTEATLAQMVIGVQRRIASARTSTATGDPALELRGLSGGNLRDATFTVHAGEIVALTGLSGSGHDEVPYLVYGRDRPRSGSANARGRPVASSPANSRRAGIALVSGDRARAGGVLQASVAENVAAPVLRSLTGGIGVIRSRKERSVVSGVLSRFDVKPGLPGIPFSALSGGNQQKALVGRWMTEPPSVLLLDEPTAGVDIGAVDSIIETLGDFAANGGAVVVASTQYDDLARLADRVLVFVGGAVVEELTGDEITPQRMLAASYGETRAAGSPSA